jgi:hypothetical protein
LCTWSTNHRYRPVQTVGTSQSPPLPSLCRLTPGKGGAILHQYLDASTQGPSVPAHALLAPEPANNRHANGDAHSPRLHQDSNAIGCRSILPALQATAGRIQARQQQPSLACLPSGHATCSTAVTRAKPIPPAPSRSLKPSRRQCDAPAVSDQVLSFSGCYGVHTRGRSRSTQRELWLRRWSWRWRRSWATGRRTPWQRGR